jgi:hypothetical protein
MRAEKKEVRMVYREAGQQPAHLDVVELVAVHVLTDGAATVKGSVEDDDEPVICHLQHKLVGLGRGQASLRHIDVLGQVLTPLAKLKVDLRDLEVVCVRARAKP